jgi:transposase
MGKTAVAIALSEAERVELLSLARAQKTGQALARRARIVLAAADGLENKAICDEVDASENTVGKWRRRFSVHHLDGLYDEPRPGAPRQIGDEEIAETIRMTLEARPADATHWSLRSMAKAVGHAPSTVHRIWKAFGWVGSKFDAYSQPAGDVAFVLIARWGGGSTAASPSTPPASPTRNLRLEPAGAAAGDRDQRRWKGRRPRYSRWGP